MAIYRELTPGQCAHCRRRVVYVRVVEAISPWLYELLDGSLPRSSLLAWTRISVVRLPWECLECGCALASQPGQRVVGRRARALEPALRSLVEPAAVDAQHCPT